MPTLFPWYSGHSFQDQLPTSTNDIYQAAAKLWEPWLKPEALVTLREGKLLVFRTWELVLCLLIRPLSAWYYYAFAYCIVFNLHKHFHIDNPCRTHNTLIQHTIILLDPEFDVFCEGGFYSQMVQPKLRLISLNTILYYCPNKVTVNMSDPAGQFRWLQDTLEASAQSMEKVNRSSLHYSVEGISLCLSRWGWLLNSPAWILSTLIWKTG